MGKGGKSRDHPVNSGGLTGKPKPTMIPTNCPAPAHSCCQPPTVSAPLVQPSSSSCCAGVHGKLHDQGLGFPPLTVQPMLEAWVEGVKKELLHKQELMVQH